MSASEAFLSSIFTSSLFPKGFPKDIGRIVFDYVGEDFYSLNFWRLLFPTNFPKDIKHLVDESMYKQYGLPKEIFNLLMKMVLIYEKKHPLSCEQRIILIDKIMNMYTENFGVTAKKFIMDFAARICIDYKDNHSNEKFIAFLLEDIEGDFLPFFNLSHEEFKLTIVQILEECIRTSMKLEGIDNIYEYLMTYKEDYHFLYIDMFFFDAVRNGYNDFVSLCQRHGYWGYYDYDSGGLYIFIKKAETENLMSGLTVAQKQNIRFYEINESF
jgi:hypothetical protein